MPKQKAAPFYLFLLHLRDENRRETGVYISPDRMHAYAAAKWADLDATGRSHWKAMADRKNAEARLVPPIIRTAVKDPVPFELKSRHQRNLHLAEEYLSICGPERLSLMKRDFISCSITPFFKSAEDPEVFYPGEICFTRWSIARGVEEVYLAYLDPDVGDEGRHVTPREWKDWSSIMSCKDRITIAKEILLFIGRAGGVLVRENHMRKIESCLNFFFREVDLKIKLLDQQIILHHMIERETNAKKLALQDVRKEFFARHGKAGIRMSVEGVDTGVRCSWHDNKTFCSARNVVEDSYVLTQMLGEVFCANILPGTHWPTFGKLLPKRDHVCSRRIDACRMKKRCKAEWEGAGAIGSPKNNRGSIVDNEVVSLNSNENS